MLTEYERDAIRPHVLGKFRDLLEATAKSPAMLFYLDNWMSADPERPARRSPRSPRAAAPGAAGSARPRLVPAGARRAAAAGQNAPDAASTRTTAAS